MLTLPAELIREIHMEALGLNFQQRGNKRISCFRQSNPRHSCLTRGIGQSLDVLIGSCDSWWVVQNFDRSLEMTG